MKRLKSSLLLVFLLLAFLLLSACGGGGPGGEVSPGISPLDGFQKNFAGGDGESLAWMLEGDNLYYYNDGTRMYYIDKATMRCVVACSRPDCSHAGDDLLHCDAFWGTNLTCWNGRLYYTGILNNDAVILSRAADGTDEVVEQVMVKNTGGGSISRRILAVDDGRAVYQFQTDSLLPGANVFCADLSDISSAADVLLDYTDSDIKAPVSEVWNLWVDDGLFYCYGVSRLQGDSRELIYRLDPVSRKLELVWSVPDAAQVGDWDSAGVSANGLYITGGQLYYFLSGNGLWRYDLSTGENVRLAEIRETAQRGTAAFDGQYIYINNGGSQSQLPLEDRALFLYDMEGAFVTTIPTGQLFPQGDYFYQDAGVLGGDAEHLFVRIQASGQGFSKNALYYLNKTALGDSQWIELEA